MNIRLEPHQFKEQFLNSVRQKLDKNYIIKAVFTTLARQNDLLSFLRRNELEYAESSDFSMRFNFLLDAFNLYTDTENYGPMGVYRKRGNSNEDEFPFFLNLDDFAYNDSPSFPELS